MQRQRLPIFKNKDHIIYLLEKYQTLVLVGETGCGKSTQVPQALPVIGKTHSQHNDRSCSHKELLTLHGKFGTIKNQIVDSDASRAEKGRRGGPDREECHRLNIDQRADTI
ncbi:DHX35 helicase, partial [Acromyrmex insinuator]